MKAARLYAAGDLRIEDIDAPQAPSAGWVRLDVRSAGICGSDLHNYRTGQWITRAPSVAGHEFCGVVTALGEGVGGLSVGDAVVADSRVWCGQCPACLSGRRNMCQTLGFVGEVCDGGFAEQALLPARLVVRLPPGLDPEIACMAEPMAVALHAVGKLSVPQGEPVAVIGCGPIGGLAALLLSRLHTGALHVVDRNRARAQTVATATGARVSALSDLQDAEIRYALDASGSIAVLRTLCQGLAGGGAIALVGIVHGRIDIDPIHVVEREISLIGCHAFKDELPEAVMRLIELAAPLHDFIDAVIGIEDVPAAYERLLRGEARGLKTIIKLDGGRGSGGR